MVELSFPDAETSDIPLHLRILLFMGIYVVLYVTMEFYRHKPFMSFYTIIQFAWFIPAAIYLGYDLMKWSRQILMVMSLIFMSLWRISAIERDTFEHHFAGCRLNKWVHNKVHDKLNRTAMEWIIWSVVLMLNFVVAIYLDFSIGSYFNAGCGVILTVTTPLPSIGHRFPGYRIKQDPVSGAVDMVIPDMKWPWILVLTAWNALFEIAHFQNIWMLLLLTLPLFYASLPFWNTERYLMSRVVCVYMITLVLFPWKWFLHVLGTPPIIENPKIVDIWGLINLCLGVASAIYYIGPVLNNESRFTKNMVQPYRPQEDNFEQWRADREHDWKLKDSFFGKRFAFLNKVYTLTTMMMGLLSLMIHLALLVVFVVLPFTVLFICDFSNLCCGRSGLNPISYLRKRMGLERVYLSTYDPVQRGVMWRIRDYIQTFYSGLDSAIFLARCQPDIGAGRRMEAEAQRKLYGGMGSKYFPLNGSVCTADYATALEMYSDRQQAHEFATAFDMHSVVGRFCPFYSLAQTMETEPFKFIDTLHRTLNKRAKDNFREHQTPPSVHVPAPDTKPSELVPKLFSATIASTFFKLTGEQMEEEDIKCFESNFPGIPVIGLLPPRFLNFFGDLIPSKYWSMVSLLRSKILANEALSKIVYETAKECDYHTNRRVSDYCINSFCVELVPGSTGIVNAVIEGLKQFNGEDGEEQKRVFQQDPENFALECLRFAGVPFVGRTVLRAYREIEFDGIMRPMHPDNSIISDIASIARCPVKFWDFGGPDSFNAERDNLKKDLFTFGSTEERIRNGTAEKKCPFHDFGIMMVQELLGRIAGIQINVVCNGVVFENTYQHRHIVVGNHVARD